jgi:WG containing repeat
LVEKSGKEIVLPYYDLILTFDNDTLTPMLLNGKVGFIDNRGTVIIPVRYEAVSISADGNIDFPRSPRFSEDGLAPMKLNGKYGFIDREGDEVIPFKYDKVSDFDLFGEGVARVKLNEKVIYIDKNGSEVKKPKGAP